MIGSFQLTTLLIALVGSAAEEPLLRKPHDVFSGRHKTAKAATEPPEQPQCNTCPTYDNRDWTNREGLGESPGIPNLEYLGLGYNIFEGNPRGSDISEADPGFRSPVVKLRQEQTTLTIDQEYMVPLGVDVRYITACKFASKATELSSDTEYRSEVSKEASQSVEASGGISAGLFSISANYAFKESSQYKAFSETTQSLQTVTYEARALCSEFKASFKPYYSHVLDETFEAVLDSLSFPWTNSPQQREEYAEFFEAFGTHYVRDVTLGAKHVFSSEIKSKDVTELSREEVDISSTLSWGVQASFGGGGQGNTDYGQLVRMESEGELEGVGSTKVFKYVFEESSVGGKTSTETTLDESLTQSTVDKVRSKVSTVKELNVGGNPPEDGNWKSWATTVRDRPMPISYELKGMWTLMNETSQEAFKDAIVELYNIDLRERKDDSIIKALRFGVYSGDGSAISSYNKDPGSNYRSNVRLTVKEGFKTSSEYTGDIVTTSDADLDVADECPGDEDGTWTAFKNSPNLGYFACGMQVRKHADLDGLGGLNVRFCKYEEWDIQEDVTVRNSGSGAQGWVMCPYDQYIIGLKVKADATVGDNQGIDGLWFYCAADGTPESENQVYFDDEGGSYSTKKRSGDKVYMRGIRVRYCSDNGIGLIGMDLEFAEPSGVGSPFSSYEYELSREGDQIAGVFATAIRSNVGKNRQEDRQQVGFSIFSASAKKDIFNVMGNYPFGFFEEDKATVLVQNFKGSEFKRNELQSFSFLSAENLPVEEYVVGVVHPDGYAVNDNFRGEDVGFEVEQITGSKFLVSFPELSNPTFLVFPLWFPAFGGSYPPDLGSVIAATEKCVDGEGCYVSVGAGDSSLADYNLGFSFLALDGSLEADRVSGIVHGVVNVVSNANASPTVTFVGSGLTATAHYSSSTAEFKMNSGDNNQEEIKFEGYGGGVLITFDNPFRGLPSVIVNPIYDGKTLKMGDGLDQFALPYAVVEHITEKSVFVKADWLDTTDNTEKTFEPISFHIVVVGPQSDPFAPGTRIF